MSRARVLVVGSSTDTQEVMERKLQEAGFDVLVCPAGGDLQEALHEHKPDLVVLDLELADRHGLDVCREVAAARGRGVIALAPEGDSVSGIVSLELGADDFICKPVDMRELSARAKAVLRRLQSGGVEAEPGSLRVGGLEVDERTHLVRVNGRSLSLGPIDCMILSTLMRRVGHVCTREELCEAAWGQAHQPAHKLTMHINNLRNKIEPDPRRPRYLLTVRGVGYKISDRPET